MPARATYYALLVAGAKAGIAAVFTAPAAEADSRAGRSGRSARWLSTWIAAMFAMYRVGLWALIELGGAE